MTVFKPAPESDPSAPSARGDHLDLIGVEKTELGTDHAEVGGWLARQWQLPGIYEIALQGSHDPREAMVYGNLLAFVQIAAVSGLLADIWVSDDSQSAVCHAWKNAKRCCK